ncbi:type IV pilus biogenesis protein PilM [Stutzerimonas kirkiae]|uniref:Pilus assembly protein PilM n=1 Tax=Stutzerimonas kirkiae TaxID=2211392 RepID=A0A4Q9R0Q2_9GAMM|nr:type IV pilus assembly protein PilM [Stutzerimonas kirkiae]TBU92159.1 pilus assembly protein PilM [Stutzerimonas kirkiae]TBU99529.1 pilus assembly protein PilM [Stutzerimonas kirkiae]TBV10442.1 pilus assembly protein PilM [Stutzerimonas kirkiae]TBV14002.1 pilus assembly protein PilM [Stutzerimonas kirkiae]
MTGLFGRKAVTALGIDIGSTSVRLVELSRHGAGHRLEAWAMEPLADGAVVRRQIRDPALVGTALARAMARVRIRAASAVVAVCGAAVVTRTLEMEAGLGDEEMHLQLRLEANRHIPYPLEDVAIDFEVRERTAHDPGRVSVFLAACRREHVQSREAALALAGLRARAVDIEPCAIERVYRLLSCRLPPGDAVALLEVDTDMLRLDVLHDGYVCYSREQYFDERLPSDGPRDPAVFMVAESLRALQFFQASGPPQAIGRIWLAGPAATVPGVAPLLQRRSAMATGVVDPFLGMSPDGRSGGRVPAEIAPALLLACGLALGGLR